MYPHLQPTRRYEFPLPKPSRHLRLVQTDSGNAGKGLWSISELHLLAGGEELPHSALTLTEPNPWEVRFAADGNFATRWITGETYKPGMHVDLEVSGPKLPDRLVVDCSVDQPHMTMQLFYKAGRQWTPVPGQPRVNDVPVQADLRRAALQALKQDGIGWLVITDDGYEAKDFRTHRYAWPVIERARTNRYSLYEIP